MRRIFYRLSYRVRVSIVMALFAVIPLSLFGNFYLKSEWKKWEATALGEYQQLLAVSSEHFGREVQDIELKLLHISNMISIRTAILGIDTMSMAESLDYVETLREVSASITADNNHLTVRWYPYKSSRNYGRYSYTLDSFRQEFAEEDLLLDKILKLGNGKLFKCMREVNRVDNKKENVETRLCVYAKVGTIGEGDCLLEMSLPFEKMIDIQSKDLPEGSILGMCLQLNGEQQTFLLSSPGEAAETILDTYHRTGKCPGYYSSVSQVEGLQGSQLTCLFPKDYVLEQIYDDIIRFVVIILLFLATVIACSYMASTMLTNRVTRFLEQMNNELDMILLEPTAAVIDDSDFQGIEKRIRKLILSTQEHYAKLEQYEAEKNRLELELLQMRFNPHFLYNTLNSIRYQVKERRVRKSIDSLIHYYRIVLSKGHLRIQIKEEIEMIREYLELQIFAYDLVNVRYEIAVEEAVKPRKIIKHLLQPIVENALEHGLRTNGDQGIIKIRARLEDQDIIFEIEDNGAGMTKEQAAAVLSEPACGSVGGGYGVYNVQQRIEAYYGTGYGINFHSTPGVGTCVTIRIPWDKCGYEK